MFEGNTISFKDNNVTLLSKKLAILYLASSTISLKQINPCPFENASHSFEGKASLTKKNIVSVALCV